MYRKLVVCDTTSPPEDYEGGELIVKTSPKDIQFLWSKGKMILFPSFYPTQSNSSNQRREVYASRMAKRK